MSLAIGSRIGVYDILAPLGAGGMGEVYRARDTKLNREVALKILPESFASDGDRVARFRREAQALAALNHPHIAQIHGFEDSTGTHALVMELVEGDTLADRIARGAIPIDEALPIARQIADALEAAHEKGIVHRDLKPANIKLTPDGTVKILDFGLAKATANDPPIDAANSPTFTVAATQMGVIVGTAAYMSPEQARGKAVDKRADIWAFGCVLYEMLTGASPFADATTTDILAAIVQKTPKWDVLPVDTPVAVRRLVRRCLEKDRKRRLADIADARLEIEEALAGAPEGMVSHVPRARSRVVLLSAVAALALGVVGTSLGWWLRRAETAVPARFTIPLPAGDTVADARMPLLALSPDGRTLVYAAVRGGVQRLFRRPLDDFGAEPIPGTEGAYAPFFSPDGAWLGFFDPRGVVKMPLPSGAAIRIADTHGPFARGAALLRDGGLIHAPAMFSPLSYVRSSTSAAAGAGTEPAATESLATAPAAAAAMAVYTGLEPIQHWPEALPDGKTVLFAEGGFDLTSWDDAHIVAQSLDARSRKIVVQGGTHPRYVPTGHLLYARAGSLLAARFDPGRLETIGPAVRVLEGVAQSMTGAAQYTISNDGTLAYIDGPAQSNNHGLVWIERDGRATPLKVPLNTYWAPTISPDGRFIAFSVLGPATDVWTYDIARETLTRLSIDSQKTPSVTFASPRWTPDGTRVVYEQMRGGRTAALYWRKADGSGVEERLADGAGPQRPNCWLPNGQTLLFTETRADTKSDLWLLPIAGDRKPRPFLQTPFDEFGAACAPDGSWIAYVSDESGSWEVYVRRFQGSGARIKISSAGGIAPVWTRDGKHLVYLSAQDDPQNTLVFMSVPVTLGSEFRAGRPVVVHQGRYYWEPGGNYDVAPDGRLLVMPALRDAPVGTIRVVQRWLDELKRRVP